MGRVLLALWLLALSAVAEARLAPSEGLAVAADGSTWEAVSKSSTAGRQLLGVAYCPDGCAGSDACVSDSTYGGLRCNRCKNNLRVNKVNGLCACASGKYSDASSTDACLDCPRGFFCTGGDYTYSSPPPRVQCPVNMTTLTMRTNTIRSCVQIAGYSFNYDISGTPYAARCPPDTYSPGLKKQRQCIPCPTGFTTNGLDGQISPTACIVPAGYYLKSPGQVAPCPKGEYKEGIGGNGNCTKCAFGVTTPKEGATSINNCSLVVAGYYPSAFNPSTGVVGATRVCPQKYICPGGKPTQAFDPTNPNGLSASEPTIKRCPEGVWTIELGSTAFEQCLTPPGHFTANGTTSICPAGAFRADWKPSSQATSCTPCGENVFADKTDILAVYNIVTNELTQLSITTASDDCYIKAGQGLYYSSISGTWRARNCVDNSYGVSNITYGLTAAACRTCPTDMVTSTDAVNYPNSASWYIDNGDGVSFGFYNVKACVTKAGYGVTGRGSQQCDQGAYNDKDTYTACTNCPFGLTTAGVGTGYTLADCGVMLGYGYYNGAVVPCPIGSYNNATYTRSTTQPCTPCPTGSTTTYPGSDSSSSCNLCIGGYGFANCATKCGGRGAAATYGTPGREYGSDCAACTTSETGFSFEFNFQNDVYSPLSLSRTGASASVDCLAEFAQMVDGAWYLPTTGNTALTAYPGITRFADCAAKCNYDNCEYVTFDYVAQTCYTRTGIPPVLIGAALIGFKAVPSGDVGTNAWSIKRQAEVKAVASGQYTFYRDPNAHTVGIQTAAPGAGSFSGLQDCMAACDTDSRCAGITITMNIAVNARPASCMLIKGDTQLGVFKRTMTRVDLNRLALPDLTQ